MRMNVFLMCGLSLVALPALGEGNKTIESFNKAKKLLEREVYFDHRKTLYCSADFDAKKNVVAPIGFTSKTHKKRAKRIEWEHGVPAQNFGKAFPEWRDGDASCVSNKGKPFKGRKCASKLNRDYRFMQADMYNLFPAIGSVNALRSNYNFVASVNANSDFGSCAMKIDKRKVEPTNESKGRIARTYLYMDYTYSHYRMSKQQRQLMISWDRLYPADAWECQRYKRIKNIQQNDNSIMAQRCKS